MKVAIALLLLLVVLNKCSRDAREASLKASPPLSAVQLHPNNPNASQAIPDTQKP